MFNLLAECRTIPALLKSYNYCTQSSSAVVCTRDSLKRTALASRAKDLLPALLVAPQRMSYDFWGDKCELIAWPFNGRDHIPINLFGVSHSGSRGQHLFLFELGSWFFADTDRPQVSFSGMHRCRRSVSFVQSSSSRSHLLSNRMWFLCGRLRYTGNDTTLYFFAAL